MGYESVKAIGRKLQGQPVPTRIDLPAVLVTRADLEKPDVIELLHPDLRTGFRESKMAWYKCFERATLAQLVERLIRNQQVAGSIPAGGSIVWLLTEMGHAAIPSSP